MLPANILFIRPRTRAFSLIEAAIVLGVVGLVIGGIWIAAASIAHKQRVNKVINTINVIREGTFSLYKGQNITSSNVNMTSTLSAAGIIPADIEIVTISTPYARVDGNTNIESRIRFISSERRLTFTVSTTPAICISVLNSLLINRQSIGRVDFSNYGGGTYASSLPSPSNLQDLTMALIQQDCTAGPGMFELVYIVPF